KSWCKVSYFKPNDVKVRRRFQSGCRPISRRSLLRATGVALALPLLDSMVRPSGLTALASDAPSAPPRRLFAICNNLGVLHDPFFPKDSGKNYTLSPYLQNLAEFRNDFTVMSGVSHPNVDGG